MRRTAGNLEYQLTYKKVKNLNLRLHSDGTIYVSASKRVPISEIDQFVASKEQWVRQARDRLQKQIIIPKDASKIHNKPEIRVRWMKTRWGVCYPAKHRITLNQQLLEKPLAAVEYVVMHEYMHFLIPNHQKEFHEAMQAAMPDYKMRRSLLK